MAKQKIKDIQLDDTYSTSETVVGTWIDGRPIYRKVVQGVTNATTAGQAMTIAHGITGITNSFTIVRAFTMFKIGQGNGTGSNVTQMNYFEGTGTPVNQVNLTGVDGTSISLKFGYGGWGNTWSSTVLEYVK